MHTVIDWLRVYWPWLVWPALTAVFNAASRVDDFTWARWGAMSPRLQAVLRLLRAIGIDPHTASSALRDIVAAKSSALGPRPIRGLTPRGVVIKSSPTADTLPETPVSKIEEKP